MKKVYWGHEKVPHLVPRQTLHQMYDALVEPYLEYCCEVWGCMGLCQCDRLQKLQNRAARVITSCEDYSTRSANISQDLGWVTLENRQSKLLAVSVYKCINAFYPEGISAMFNSTASVHSHNLRGSSNIIFITRPHTEAGKQAFSYRGAVLWNSLPSDLRNQPNLKSFKYSFQKYN